MWKALRALTSSSRYRGMGGLVSIMSANLASKRVALPTVGASSPPSHVLRVRSSSGGASGSAVDAA
jgi:hypothetical protein